MTSDPLSSLTGNFLGARSEKVCSGSDDGNFFVWDKETGRLEGIWEGDGHVVNGEPMFLSLGWRLRSWK